MFNDLTRMSFPSSGYVHMPLLFDPQLLRCVAVGPGGAPLTVLLDTGTDPSIIDLGLARQLGLPLGEFAIGQDAVGAEVPFTETMIPWMRLGELRFRNLFALALDLRATPFQVDMVLGYNVLQQVVLCIDYTRRMLCLSHPDLGGAEALSDEALLPLTFCNHFPALANVVLDDGVCLPLVTIDTGSNGGLTLGPDLASRLGLQPDAAAVTRASGTGFVGAGRAILCGKASSMRLGPFDLHDIDLDTPGGGGGDLCQAGRANMGNRVLARFAHVTLDYGRSLCALGPAAGTQMSRNSKARN
jgi:hypothetical protein